MFSDAYVILFDIAICYFLIFIFYRTVLTNFARNQTHEIKMVFGNLPIAIQNLEIAVLTIGYLPILKHCMLLIVLYNIVSHIKYSTSEITFATTQIASMAQLYRNFNCSYKKNAKSR